MKPTLWIALLTLTGTAWTADHGCRAEEQSMVDAEVRCIPQGGISITYNFENGAKGACMADEKVKAACGADGQGTRRMAFAQWMGRLKEFERKCIGDGGDFSFKDPTFTEPQDDSFCLQAQPEVGEGMFEEPLCNYRSLCPAVTVVCSYGCGTKDPFNI